MKMSGLEEVYGEMAAQWSAAGDIVTKHEEEIEVLTKADCTKIEMEAEGNEPRGRNMALLRRPLDLGNKGRPLSQGPKLSVELIQFMAQISTLTEKIQRSLVEDVFKSCNIEYKIGDNDISLSNYVRSNNNSIIDTLTALNTGEVYSREENVQFTEEKLKTPKNFKNTGHNELMSMAIINMPSNVKSDISLIEAETAIIPPGTGIFDIFKRPGMSLILIIILLILLLIILIIILLKMIVL
jgi:hypothetical protein